MKSHTYVYRFRCATCSFATKYSHALKVHMSKFGHEPAVVLNADGSTPTDGSGDFALVSRRGRPRGMRPANAGQPRRPKAASGGGDGGMPGMFFQMPDSSGAVEMARSHPPLMHISALAPATSSAAGRSSATYSPPSGMALPSMALPRPMMPFVSNADYIADTLRSLSSASRDVLPSSRFIQDSSMAAAVTTSMQRFSTPEPTSAWRNAPVCGQFAAPSPISEDNDDDDESGDAPLDLTSGAGGKGANGFIRGGVADWSSPMRPAESYYADRRTAALESLSTRSISPILLEGGRHYSLSPRCDDDSIGRRHTSAAELYSGSAADAFRSSSRPPHSTSVSPRAGQPASLSPMRNLFSMTAGEVGGHHPSSTMRGGRPASYSPPEAQRASISPQAGQPRLTLPPPAQRVPPQEPAAHFISRRQQEQYVSDAMRQWNDRGNADDDDGESQNTANNSTTGYRSSGLSSEFRLRQSFDCIDDKPNRRASSNDAAAEESAGRAPQRTAGGLKQSSESPPQNRWNERNAYGCDHCHISFNDRSIYSIHMEYHSEDEPFRCNLCGVRTKNSVDFFLHIARIAHDKLSSP